MHAILATVAASGEQRIVGANAQPEVAQLLSRGGDLALGLVELPAVVPDALHVCLQLAERLVRATLQLRGDRAEVHRLLDDVVVECQALWHWLAKLQRDVELRKLLHSVERCRHPRL
jgi:hypothetical protein